MTVLLVVLGAAVGAPLRYVTDLAIQQRHGSVMPWGTMTVNVAGSFVLGATAGTLAATDGPSWVLAMLGTGFCGALTTFSTFGFETLRLLEEGAVREALSNVLLSLVAGLAACAGGWVVATALLGA